MNRSEIAFEREPRVFSMRGMALLVIATLIVGYLLVPRDRELMRRMMVDGMTERAFHIMGVRNGSESGLVGRLISRSGGENEKGLLNDLNLLLPKIADPASVYRVVCAHKQKLSLGALQYLRDALALRALQLGDTRVADRIYRDLAGEGFRNWAQLRRAVATARFNAKPQLGLSYVSGYLEKNHMTHEQLPADLRKTMISLSREVNNGSQAFDLLAKEMERQRENPGASGLMAELTQVSIEAGRMEDAMPLIEGYVDMTEAGRMSWQELLQRRQEPRPSDPDFRKYGKLLAAYLEWNTRNGEAFEIYRKLSLLGDPEAVKRCATIYPWCSREDELVDLLGALYPIDGHPEYGLLFARLKAERAEFDTAEKVIRDLLQAQNENPGLWTELGHLLDQQGRFAAAIAAYEHAFRIDPAGQANAQIAAARLYVSLLRLEEAMKAYKAVPASMLTQDAGADMAALAQALTDGEGFETAQFQVIGRFTKLRAVDYAHVAGVWSAAGNPERAEQVLCQGQKAFPDSDVLVLARIDRLVERRELAGAFSMLEKAGKWSDFRYTNRLMTLALELGKTGDALRVLSLADPAAKQWHAKDRLLLAELYVKAGREDDAMQIFREVPGGEAGENRLLARWALREGEFDKAIGHQQRYLSLAVASEPAEWLFLGDLFKATGRLDESERTYAQLLAQLRGRVMRGDLLALGFGGESESGL